MNTWDELRDIVTSKDGVASVEMIVLRDILGVKKLGTHVRDQIEQQLKGSGLGHYPAELPQYQDELVRLYRLGTPLAEKIEAVLIPSEENDDKLRNLAANGDAETLDKIRALVCD